jgi:hypothetical protein
MKHQFFIGSVAEISRDVRELDLLAAATFDSVSNFASSVNCARSFQARDFNEILSDNVRLSAACWIAGFHFGESGAKRFGKQPRLRPSARIWAGLPLSPSRARADAGIECHARVLIFQSALFETARQGETCVKTGDDLAAQE